MCVPYPSLCLFQREISNAADTAARLYHEATLEALRSLIEIWDIMSKAQDRFTKSIRSRNFKKFISIAHKNNGDDFFNEVSLLSLFFIYSFILIYIRSCLISLPYLSLILLHIYVAD